MVQNLVGLNVSSLTIQPISLVWSLTRGCSEGCVYCPYARRALDTNEMSSKQIMAAITEASELGIFAISFTGGEPTLRPDWLKIVTHARQSNIHVSIATNGYAFDERTIGELVGLGVLDIALSLDHYQESYNDKLRGSGAWARFVSRARTLLSTNVRLSCSITVARETFSDIRQTLSFVRDLGI